MKNLSEVALSYRNAELSVIPVQSDKRPATPSWAPFQKRLPTPKEVCNWFGNGTGHGVALVCGIGNLEVLDFDFEAESLEQWAVEVEERSPGLYDKLLLEKSPHGAHVIYRCVSPIPGNMKLARKGIEVQGPGKHEYKGKTLKSVSVNGRHYIVPELIETRGSGGYCVVFPSKGYVLQRGSFLDLPVISEGERNILIEAARACNRWTSPNEVKKGYQAPRNKKDLLPGEDYDLRGNVRLLLQKHGWKPCNIGSDGREHWTRPGKAQGTSATLTENRVFHVFSSNATPFQPGESYGPFGTFAILECGGDLSEAAKTLNRQGYGSIKTPNHGVSQRSNSAPTMADLREYVDLCLVPGQKITVDEICRGLSCYRREDRKAVYANIGRLCKEGILKKDDYRHGGYRRVIDIVEYDLSGDIGEKDISFNVKLPLDLENFIRMKPDQVLQVSGRYDAGKSSLLFQIEADNYHNHKIVHILSDEWSLNAIKERMDALKIPRPHKNIKVVPMQPGYEDMIPAGRCIVLIDYIRADQNPFETDAQIQRILKNLDGGIAIFATQKHPGLDRPVGGQFAVHASHHIVMLDRWKSVFTCKIYRTKSEKNMEGYFKTFKIDETKRLSPCMTDWKPGGIKWERDQKGKDSNDSRDNKDNRDNVSNVVNRGGPPVKKERKERTKEKKESFLPIVRGEL
ncbi:MAG: bifunctional DNA primase/polymerase [Desulfobacteraceae bacterium]|nr:bifunctional DNA primase/polymerase [Desulfobacteraceae bacterium]